MYRLHAPVHYWDADTELRARHCNGCGPKSLLIDIVPDTIWGLDIAEACNIHDWMYAHGRSHEDKKKADDAFLANMVRLIHNAGGPSFLRFLRRHRALKYYWAVTYFGGPAFWSGKEDA